MSALQQARAPTLGRAPQQGLVEPALAGTELSFERERLGEASLGLAGDTPILDAVAGECGVDPRLPSLYERIDAAYRHQHEKRRDAIADLETDLVVDEDTPLYVELLLITAGIALSAATAGIGGAVAGFAVAGASKFVQAAVKKAVDASAQQAITAAGAGLTPDGSPSPIAFLRAQRDALGEMNYAAVDAFHANRYVFEESTRGVGDAMGLLQALLAAAEKVAPIQRFETTQQWCVYRAQTELGTDAGGTDMFDALGGSQGPDWLEYLNGRPQLDGVLQIEIEGEGDSVRIVSARLKGVPGDFRTELSNVPLREATMPIEVHGRVPDPSRPGSSTYLRIGRNERGTVWSDTTNVGADAYLFTRSGGSLTDRPDREAIFASRFDGATVVLEQDVLPTTLAHRGLTIND